MVANVQTAVFRGQAAWHGIGTVLDKTIELNSAIARLEAGLTWEPECVPLFTADNQLAPANAVIRNDTQQILGVVGKGWTPIYNEQMFEFLDSLVSTGVAEYESAGVLGVGERVWALLRIPGVGEVTQDDVLERYILAANGHDGSFAFTTFATTVRVVCQNTLNLAVNLAGKNAMKVYHTKGVLVDLERVQQGMQTVVKKFEHNLQQSRALAAVTVTEQAATTYFGNVLNRILAVTQQEREQEAAEANGSVLDAVLAASSPAEEQKKDRHQALLGDILERFEKEHATGTAWGAYNAVTEYIDHGKNYHNAKTRFNGTLLGQGNNQKQAAFRLALNEFVK